MLILILMLALACSGGCAQAALDLSTEFNIRVDVLRMQDGKFVLPEEGVLRMDRVFVLGSFSDEACAGDAFSVLKKLKMRYSCCDLPCWAWWCHSRLSNVVLWLVRTLATHDLAKGSGAAFQ